MRDRVVCCAAVIVGVGTACVPALHPPSTAPVHAKTSQVRLASVGMPQPTTPRWPSQWCSGDAAHGSVAASAKTPIAHAGAAGSDPQNSALLGVPLDAIGNGGSGGAAAPGPSVQLVATRVEIMTGTNMPDVTPEWIEHVVDDFIEPSLGGTYAPEPVKTPEKVWPFTGLFDTSLDNSIAQGVDILRARLEGVDGEPVVVSGYSQSSIIADLVKRQLVAEAAAMQPVPDVTFVLIANPGRPNGGINGRFSGMLLPGWTSTGPTPTDTPFPTVDIARQYDPFADFPLYPVNLLADLNAVLGLVVHDYGPVSLDPNDPLYVPGTVVQHESDSDTTYYWIPTEHLPLLAPLRALGIAPRLVDAIEPVLRVLVEAGYDRSIPFNQPAPARWSPEPEKIDELVDDLGQAVRSGIDIWNSASPEQMDTKSEDPTIVGKDGPNTTASPNSPLAVRLARHSVGGFARDRSTVLSRKGAEVASADGLRARDAIRSSSMRKPRFSGSAGRALAPSAALASAVAGSWRRA